MHLGEEGTEQFSVRTHVDGKLIGDKPVHDPFATTTVKLRGLRHAWNALTRGITVQVSVDASHGAISTIMMLDPQALHEQTNIFLERQAQRRAQNEATGTFGECVTQN